MSRFAFAAWSGFIDVSFVFPGKSSRFDGDQQTLDAQLKVCLVKLVDCGERQSSNAAADGKMRGWSWTRLQQFD